MSTPLERLRYHVSGAIERGEKEAIVEQTPIVEPQRELYTYTWQAWQGEKCLWEESGLTALQVLQRGRIESARVPEITFRAMAEPRLTANGWETRDYQEIWQNGRPLRAGTHAMCVHVHVSESEVR